MSDDKNTLNLFLVGFFSASCGWIKNEGNVFFIIFSVFFIGSNFRNKKYITYFILGSLLPLIVIALFKIGYSPTNDIVAGQKDGSLAKLISIKRYLQIVNYWSYYSSLYLPLQIILLLISLVKFNYYDTLAFKVILSLLVVYFFIYVITPLDLRIHLRSSLDRLMLQVTPVFLYTAFINISNKISLSLNVNKIV